VILRTGLRFGVQHTVPSVSSFLTLDSMAAVALAAFHPHAKLPPTPGPSPSRSTVRSKKLFFEPITVQSIVRVGDGHVHLLTITVMRKKFWCVVLALLLFSGAAAFRHIASEQDARTTDEDGAGRAAIRLYNDRKVYSSHIHHSAHGGLVFVRTENSTWRVASHYMVTCLPAPLSLAQISICLSISVCVCGCLLFFA